MRNFGDSAGFKALKITRRITQIFLFLGLLAILINTYHRFIGMYEMIALIIGILILVLLIGYGLIRHLGEYHSDKE